MKDNIKRIVLGVIIAISSTVIIRSCLPEPLPDCVEGKSIIGRIISDCDKKSLKGVKVDIVGFLNKQVLTDDNGMFEIKMDGCGIENQKLIFSHEDHDEKSMIYKVDFTVSGEHNIGEVELKKKKCPKCDQVTQVIYNLIDDRALKAISSTYTLKKGTISLDEAFEKELRGELENYLKDNTIGELKEKCPDKYEILRWIGRYTADNYKVGAYEIPGGQMHLINTFLGRLEEEKSKWKIKYLTINCIGSADMQNVSSISLDRGKTGISYSPSEPFQVFYDGCNENHISSGVIPVRLGYNSVYSVDTKHPIVDNCGLSATRGFVVAKYLSSVLLPDKNIEIYYSAEGAIGNPGDNPESRRVRIEITFVGASSDDVELLD